MKRKIVNKLACWLAGGMCLCLVAGCGSSSNRKAVEGTMTLDDQPLHDGNIVFRPALRVNGGPSAGGRIVEGKFFVSSQQGIFIGKFRVEITARRKTGRQETTLTGQMVDQYEQYLPERYNRQSELTAEVTEEGPNYFVFNLGSE